MVGWAAARIAEVAACGLVAVVQAHQKAFGCFAGRRGQVLVDQESHAQEEEGEEEGSIPGAHRMACQGILEILSVALESHWCPGEIVAEEGIDCTADKGTEVAVGSRADFWDLEAAVVQAEAGC